MRNFPVRLRDIFHAKGPELQNRASLRKAELSFREIAWKAGVSPKLVDAVFANRDLDVTGSNLKFTHTHQELIRLHEYLDKSMGKHDGELTPDLWLKALQASDHLASALGLDGNSTRRRGPLDNYTRRPEGKDSAYEAGKDVRPHSLTGMSHALTKYYVKPAADAATLAALRTKVEAAQLPRRAVDLAYDLYAAASHAAGRQTRHELDSKVHTYVHGCEPQGDYLERRGELARGRMERSAKPSHRASQSSLVIQESANKPTVHQPSAATSVASSK